MYINVAVCLSVRVCPSECVRAYVVILLKIHITTAHH